MNNKTGLSLSLLMSLFCFTAFADIHVFDQNVEAHITMSQACHNNPSSSPDCIKKVVDYINSNSFDFLTTQEKEAWQSWDISDPVFNLHDFSRAGSQEDAMIFYNKNNWKFKSGDYKVMNVTPDDKDGHAAGPRTVIMAHFTPTHGTGPGVVVASTHLCVDWPNGSDGCYFPGYAGPEREVKAHEHDVAAIADALNKFYPGLPVIFTGDFNTKGADQQTVPEVMQEKGYDLSMKELPFDFAFHKNGLLSVKSKKEKPWNAHPDHPGLDILYSNGQSTGCDMPTEMRASRHTINDPVFVAATLPSSTDPNKKPNWFELSDFQGAKVAGATCHMQGNQVSCNDPTTVGKQDPGASSAGWVYQLQVRCPADQVGTFTSKITYKHLS